MRQIFREFEMLKAQRYGFFVLIILIIIVEFGFYFFKETHAESKLSSEEKEWLNSSSEIVNKKVEKIQYHRFDPNKLDLEGWMKLGFSQKQSNVILKYKTTILGGSFKNLADIEKCYVIGKEKFIEIKPYVEISKIKKEKNYSEKIQKIKKRITPFDPNKLSLKDWQKLGFSEKQSKVILKYKKSILKGKFSSLSQIENCYVINREKFLELKPFIRIKEVQKGKITSVKSNELNINQFTKKEWIGLGATKEQANNILKYRDFIGGFREQKDITECEFITSEIRLKLADKNIKFLKNF